MQKKKKKKLDTEHYNSKTKSTKLNKGTSKTAVTGRCKLPFSDANLQSRIRKITTEILLFCKQLHLATQQAIKYTKCKFSQQKKINVNLNFLGLVHIRFLSKCIDLCAKTLGFILLCINFLGQWAGLCHKVLRKLKHSSKQARKALYN